MASDDFENDLYKNWVRGAKGLEYLQEGLRDFLRDLVQYCRNQHLKTIIQKSAGSKQHCNQCTSQNLLPEHANYKQKYACNITRCIQQSPGNCFGSSPKGRRKCPNGICSILYDKIVLEHASRDPLWKNTDPSTWCSDQCGWSFAKCFQTTICPGTSAVTTDAAGLLSILINNLTIQNWLACNDMDSKTTCPFNRARDIRNSILHSPKLELDDATLGYYLHTFITVLQDDKCLSYYKGSQQALLKLSQLACKQINISQRDETTLLKNRKEALSELDEKTASAVREIDEKMVSALSTLKDDVNERVTAAVSDLQEASKLAGQDVKESTKSGLSDLEKARRVACQDVKERTQSGLSDLEKARRVARQDVNESTKSGLSDLEEARRVASHDVSEGTKSGLSDLEEARRVARQDVNESTKSGLSDLEEARRVASHDVNESIKSGLSDLEKAKKEAKQNVKEITKYTLSNLKEARRRARQDVIERTKTALSDVEGAMRGARQDIDERKDTCLSEIEVAKCNAIAQLQQGRAMVAVSGGAMPLASIDSASSSASVSGSVGGKTQATLKDESTMHRLFRKLHPRKSKSYETKSELQVLQSAENDWHAKYRKRKTKEGTETSNVLNVSQLAEDDVYAQHKKQGKRGCEINIEEVHTPQLTVEDEYSRHLKQLKEDLIVLYRLQYHTLPLSPLIEEEDTPLLKLYVMPDINLVEIHRSLGGGTEIKSKVKSLQDVFFKNSRMCREIYLTADAGLGKTAFCKRLVLTWCHAHKPIENEEDYFEKEDVRAMSQYKIVFLLSLRECSEEYDIDEMIMKQIIPSLANTSVTLGNLEMVLSKEKYLVILDGLDEWTHASSSCKVGPRDIPHRKARDCSILTTTRPWKLSIINLSSSQIDQKLELVGLNDKTADKLKRTVISLLSDKNENFIENHICDFNSAVDDAGISDLETIPLLLLYLLCLWCDEIDLGRSRCELYCQIVEMLLKRTFKKYPNMQLTHKLFRSGIPQCFAKQENCRKHFGLLIDLGQLAFQTLFNETRKTTLVFDSTVAEECLNQEYLELSFRSGIITQEKDRNKLTKQIKKTLFSHKTVHEFFAALYISISSDQESVLTKVRSFCNSVAYILDMSKVFVFINGINAELLSLLSKDLMKTISEDEIMTTYRSTTLSPDYEKYDRPVKYIQNMYISCIKEYPYKHDLKLCLQDFVIDKDCQKEKYYTNLQRLAIQNKDHMKSISIKVGIRSLPDIIDSFALAEIISIEKVHYRGENKPRDLTLLLCSSVKCASVISSKWQDDHFVAKCCSWSRELSSRMIQSMIRLEAIYIDNFKISNDELEMLLNYLTNRKSMKEIKLFNLSSADKSTSCDRLGLNLSHHSNLKTLGLQNIPLAQLSINASSLEVSVVGRLSKPGLVSSYLSYLPTAAKLHTFKCSSLESACDIEAMLQTLPLLIHLKEVRLIGINLGNRYMSLSQEMVNIEHVWLDRVTMSISSFRAITSVLNKLPKSVRVVMKGCKIEPTIRFEKLKKLIHSLDEFVVSFDGLNQSMQYMFVFNTTEINRV